jgi:predicted ester cyclase
MKQHLSIALTAILFLVMACRSGGNTPAAQKTDDAAQRNLLAAAAINTAMETGDVSNLGDYIAPDAINHSVEHGDIRGLDSIKAFFSPTHRLAANDLKFNVVKELADSEYAFQWLRLTGTAVTVDMGVPIGGKFDLPLVSVYKFQHGKVTEQWYYLQLADIMKMIDARKGK